MKTFIYIAALVSLVSCGIAFKDPTVSLMIILLAYLEFRFDTLEKQNE